MKVAIEQVVPSPLRETAMVDRILLDEVADEATSSRRRLAIDFSAGLGRGEPYLGS